MNVLIVEESDEAALAALNDASDDRKLAPVELVDGRKALNADLLNDSGPGQTWEAFGDFLDGLTIDDVAMSEFEAPQIS
jgi:hypothetical protein